MAIILEQSILHCFESLISVYLVRLGIIDKLSTLDILFFLIIRKENGFKVYIDTYIIYILYEFIHSV